MALVIEIKAELFLGRAQKFRTNTGVGKTETRSFRGANVPEE